MPYEMKLNINLYNPPNADLIELLLIAEFSDLVLQII